MLRQEELTRLEDLTVCDVKPPDYVVITFAVCTVGENACGWGGWMLEGTFATSIAKSGILANGDDPLSSLTLQICPNCGGETFRTDTAQVYDLVGLADLRMKGR